MRAVLLTAVLLAAAPAGATLDDLGRARAALERGEVLPLRAILDIVETEVEGRVIEVEYEEDDGRRLYEIEIVTPDGRLLEIVADAVTGRILAVEEDDED